ncbi:hypothetical protein TNIN_457601 [Trichonephila inaurata madagascariensis]|uniref:Reverse transcriptase n=1 Tax=Trichonephila inaurata madagascariensis TaxID=2747483 RepID=A0A8X6X3N7_9ARAC|nr:hypothetical protein TNIN_457601 [Trichonephila inaurata madagascariensis]
MPGDSKCLYHWAQTCPFRLSAIQVPPQIPMQPNVDPPTEESQICQLFTSQNVQEHILISVHFLKRLDYCGLTIKPSKCTFGVDSLKFLGFQVSSEGTSPLPDRVDAIEKFPRPKTKL